MDGDGADFEAVGVVGVEPSAERFSVGVSMLRCCKVRRSPRWGYKLVAAVDVDIAVVPIQPTYPAPITNPPKLLPVCPRGRDVRDADGIRASVEDGKGGLLPVGLADLVVLELTRADVAAVSAAKDLLIVVVDANHLKAAVAAAGPRAAVEGGCDADIAGVGSLAGEQAGEEAVDADCVGHNAEDGNRCAHGVDREVLSGGLASPSHIRRTDASRAVLYLKGRVDSSKVSQRSHSPGCVPPTRVSNYRLPSHPGTQHQAKSPKPKKEAQLPRQGEDKQ